VGVPPELLSPWALGLLGLCIGSFLNVVIHRFPVVLERQWWADVAHQLGDTESWRRVFGAETPLAATAASSALGQAIDKLPVFGRYAFCCARYQSRIFAPSQQATPGLARISSKVR
jgi:leader peptidase (prepilin peptidase)/N-methyltransferase